LTNREGAFTTIDLPHEPGAWVRVKILSHTEIDEAKAERLKSVVRGLGDWTPELRKEMREGRDQVASAATVKDPRNDYDKSYVLRHAVVGWSYYQDDPSDEDIDALDPETADLIFDRVVPVSRDETALKNGSSPLSLPLSAEPLLPTNG
jgi:hypothetical protein